MAKTDVPAGWEYDPKTRGAYNPATGERISRRQVEKLRIAQETGTSGSFESKARRRREQAINPAVQLPRRVKRPRALHAYVVHSLPEVVAVISALPAGAEVYVKALVREQRDRKYRSRQRTRVWVWVSLSRVFRAKDVMSEYPDMVRVRAQFAPAPGVPPQVAAYEIIVRRIVP